MPKQPKTSEAKTGKASEPKKPRRKRPFVYTGPPLPPDQQRKLKDAFSKLPPGPPELDRSVLSRLDRPAPSSPVRKSGAGGRPRLLSKSEIKQAKKAYNELLDKDPHRWSPQQAAAKHLAVKVLKLPETVWQTLQHQVVVPELERRGLKQRPKK
jgi:hypothetical protein